MTPTEQLDGRYDLGEEIGRGGMGEVYRARDTRLGRSVAVKFLRDAPTADPRRFEAEWRTLAGFSHPNLVRLYDAGEWDGRAFLVMELVEGSTLATRMNGTPLPPAEVARIGDAVARALAYVHAKGVVHRDVKPGNILLGDDGGVWLADFGVARLVDTTGLTGTGLAIGTPAYLAPEQVEGTEVGPPADVYALGLVLLEALTGRRAYEGTPAEMTAARLHHGPDIGTELPAGWRELLASMTARNAGDRIAASAAAAALAGVLSSEAVSPDATVLAAPAFTAELTPTAVIPHDTVGYGGGQKTAVYGTPPGATVDGALDAAAPRAPWSPKKRIALISALAGVGVAVLLAALLSGGGPPAKALGPTGTATTTSAPTTTTTTTSSTTTTTTTTLPVATTPVAKAADGVLSVLQNGVADGGIAQNAEVPLINSLGPLLVAGNSGAQQGGPQQQAALQQLVGQVDQGENSGAINAATATALTPVLNNLASAVGVSLTTTTNPPPPPGPVGKGHGHGHDRQGN